MAGRAGHPGRRRLAAVVLAAAAVTVLAQPARDARAKEGAAAICRDGRFVVADGPLVSSATAVAVDAVVVAATRVSLASGCPPARAHLSASRRGTRVRVVWRRCPGILGKAALRGIIRDECRTLDATFTARRASIQHSFRAARSRCGDGVVDASTGEACDVGRACPDGGTCASDCTCAAPGVPVVPLGPICGNGFVESAEQCDDGNTVPGDGCGATCQAELAIVTEVEPNSPATRANRVSLVPAIVTGHVGSSTDEDYFAFPVTGGTRIRLETFDGTGMTCNGIDTYLELCAPDGTTALASNDDGGLGTCSRVDSGILPAATYFARVMAADGRPIPLYQLRLSRLP